MCSDGVSLSSIPSPFVTGEPELQGIAVPEFRRHNALAALGQTRIGDHGSLPPFGRGRRDDSLSAAIAAFQRQCLPTWHGSVDVFFALRIRGWGGLASPSGEGGAGRAMRAGSAHLFRCVQGA